MQEYARMKKILAFIAVFMVISVKCMCDQIKISFYVTKSKLLGISKASAFEMSQKFVKKHGGTIQIHTM